MDLIEIHDGNEPRFLMPIESQYRASFALPVLGDTDGTPRLIPRDQWKPVNMTGLNVPILDQGNVGACNAFSTANTMHYARAMAGNMGPQLWPGWLYRQINGGEDRGSLLEDAIKVSMSKGVPFANGRKMNDWKTTSLGIEQEAAANRVLEWMDLPTVDHLASAVQQGFACNIGIMWSDGDKTDGDGWLSVNPRGRQGGHAVCVQGIGERNGEWGFFIDNSWNTSWGMGGRFFLPLKRAERDQEKFGWFAVRQVTYHSGETIPAPQE